MYNTTSVLRTMELMLGLRPMTHFDAGARPMSAAFQTHARSRALCRREAAHPARRAQSRALATAAAIAAAWISSEDDRDR